MNRLIHNELKPQVGGNTVKNIIVSLMYIAFGLGSLPEMPLDGGMLIIGIYQQKPQVEHRITSSGVYLFSMDM